MIIHPIRRTASGFALLGVLFSLGCGKGPDEGDGADMAATEVARFVPDTTIQRDVQDRLDADPRLQKDGVEIRVHSEEGEVTLVGTVPSRYELQMAREAAMSAPGVKKVYLDSLEVASEPRREEPTAQT